MFQPLACLLHLYLVFPHKVFRLQMSLLWSSLWTSKSAGRRKLGLRHFPGFSSRSPDTVWKVPSSCYTSCVVGLPLTLHLEPALFPILGLVKPSEQQGSVTMDPCCLNEVIFYKSECSISPFFICVYCFCLSPDFWHMQKWMQSCREVVYSSLWNSSFKLNGKA